MNTVLASDNAGEKAGTDPYEIGLCWEEMAPPHEAEAWATYHFMTPEALAQQF